MKASELIKELLELIIIYGDESILDKNGDNIDGVETRDRCQ
jgi:hypothetical protein